MVIKERVNSSAIDRIEYDIKTHELTIFFNSNIEQGYGFYEVPYDEVQAFLKAKSKGQYYHRRIKSYAVR